MKRLFWFILLSCMCIVNYAQQSSCSCKDEEYDHINCSPTLFDNHTQIFWSYNCDSAWLTFKNLKQENVILLSMDMIDYVGKLGIVSWIEYNEIFACQVNHISGCCALPSYAIYNKDNGIEWHTIENILYASPDKHIPIGFSMDDQYIIIHHFVHQKIHKIPYDTAAVKKYMKEADLMNPYDAVMVNEIGNNTIKLELLPDNKILAIINLKKYK